MEYKGQTKKQIIEGFAQSAQDTGSVEVQVALLTSRIEMLTEHMKTHRKDFSSKQGLLKLVSRRRRFLNYLQRKNSKGYESLIGQLELKK